MLIMCGDPTSCMTSSSPSSLQLWSLFIYSCECRTLKLTLQRSLDGCYTRMLRAVLNVHQSEHVTYKHLYGELPRLSDKISVRTVRLASYCHRHGELPTNKLVLWKQDMHTDQKDVLDQHTWMYERKMWVWIYWRTSKIHGRSGWLETL